MGAGARRDVRAGLRDRAAHDPDPARADAEGPRLTAGTRYGVALLTAGVSAVAAAYVATIVLGVPPGWAPWALAVGASASSVAMFVLGAATRGVLTRGVAALLAALGTLLLAAFGAAIALPAAGEPLLLGLPRRLAIVFYAVGFIPLLVLPLVFARTMPRSGPGGAHGSAEGGAHGSAEGGAHGSAEGGAVGEPGRRRGASAS